MKFWTVTSCIPGERDPVIPTAFATMAEAEAFMDKVMRDEWGTNHPFDDDGNPMEYPGDWVKSQDLIAADDAEEIWGAWAITEHEIAALDNPKALSHPQASEPVAWRWRVVGETEWRYNPTPAWIEKYGHFSSIEVEPLYASPQPANPVQVTDAVKAASDAVWNGFLYGIDSITWNGAFARAPSLDDADKIARLVIAAIGAGGQAVALLEKPTQAMRIAYDELNNSLGLDRFVNFDLVWEKIRSHLPAHPAPSEQTVTDEVISEARELDRREAFKAGWWTNAAYDQPSGYLEGCEDMDFAEYKKKGLDAYITDLLAAFREASDEALSQPHPADERVVEARLAHIDGIYLGAIDNLLHHQIQLDMDGVNVGVSRQALCEVLDGLNACIAAKEGR